MSLSNEDFAKKYAADSPHHRNYMAGRLKELGRDNDGLTRFVAEFASTPDKAKAMLADLGKSENSAALTTLEEPSVGGNVESTLDAIAAEKASNKAKK